MKTSARIIIAALVALLVSAMSATSADARGGHGGRWGHGPRVGIGLWLGPGWGWPNYYPSYYYPYYPAEPQIVIQQPEIYVPPTPQEEQPVYWYFCKDPQGYYPYVRQCPSGWMKVEPTPPDSSSEPKE